MVNVYFCYNCLKWRFVSRVKRFRIKWFVKEINKFGQWCNGAGTMRKDVPVFYCNDGTSSNTLVIFSQVRNKFTMSIDINLKKYTFFFLLHGYFCLV